MEFREGQEGNEPLDFLVESLFEVADFLARDLQQRKSAQVQEWGVSWKKEGKLCPLGYQGAVLALLQATMQAILCSGGLDSHVVQKVLDWLCEQCTLLQIATEGSVAREGLEQQAWVNSVTATNCVEYLQGVLEELAYFSSHTQEDQSISETIFDPLTTTQFGGTEKDVLILTLHIQSAILILRPQTLDCPPFTSLLPSVIQAIITTLADKDSGDRCQMWGAYQAAQSANLGPEFLSTFPRIPTSILSQNRKIYGLSPPANEREGGGEGWVGKGGGGGREGRGGGGREEGRCLVDQTCLGREERAFWVCLVEGMVGKVVEEEGVVAGWVCDESAQRRVMISLAVFGFFTNLAHNIRIFFAIHEEEVTAPLETFLSFLEAAVVIFYPAFSRLYLFQLYHEVVVEELGWIDFFRNAGIEKKEGGREREYLLSIALWVCEEWVMDFGESSGSRKEEEVAIFLRECVRLLTAIRTPSRSSVTSDVEFFSDSPLSNATEEPGSAESGVSSVWEGEEGHPLWGSRFLCGSISALYSVASSVWRSSQLLSTDVRAARVLVQRCLTGSKLTTREKKTLKRAIHDVAVAIPIGIVMLVPITPVGHACFLLGIQQYLPSLMPSFLSSDRLEIARQLESLCSLKPTLCAYIERGASEAQILQSPHKCLLTDITTLPTTKDSMRLSILNESPELVARPDWSCWGVRKSRPKVV